MRRTSPELPLHLCVVLSVQEVWESWVRARGIELFSNFSASFAWTAHGAGVSVYIYMHISINIWRGRNLEGGEFGDGHVGARLFCRRVRCACLPRTQGGREKKDL